MKIIYLVLPFLLFSHLSPSHAGQLIDKSTRQAIYKAIYDNDVATAKRLLSDINEPDIVLDRGIRPLHLALQKGSVPIVRQLLEQGADPNSQTKNGAPALYYAYSSGSEEFVDLLLQNRANLEASAPAGINLIHAASKGGNPKLVKRLLDAGADPNSMNKEGKTPLYYLLKNKNNPEARLATFRLLLDKGANPDSVDSDERPALIYASSQNTSDFVRELISRSVNSNSSLIGGWAALGSALNESCINCPCNEKMEEIAFLLLDAGAFIEPKGYKGTYPLVTAAKRNCIGVVRKLLELGANPNYKGESPLMYAYQNGNEELVDLLLKHGANDVLGPDGETALHYAARGSNPQLLERLLKSEEDPNSRLKRGKQTPLYEAFSYPNRPIEVVQKMATTLIENGADLYNLNANGQTALDLAAYSGSEKILEYLLEKGMNPNHKDESGRNALHRALNKGNREDIVLRLISSGANLNVRDNNGVTPLEIAVKNGYTDIVRLLILNGARLESSFKDKSAEGLLLVLPYSPLKIEMIKLLIELGVDVKKASTLKEITPLHLAANTGQIDMAELLVANGHPVDASFEDNGWTALTSAAWYEQTEMVKWLLAKGANPNVKCTSSPLHNAVNKGNVEIVKILLDAGAKTVLSDPCRQPLFNASRASGEIVQLILSAGADPNVECDPTPLLEFADDGNTAGVKLLLANGADPNFQSSRRRKRTPLHFAANKGLVAMVESLLEAGADPSLHDERGQTPLDLAVAGGHAMAAKAIQATMSPLSSAEDKLDSISLAVQYYSHKTAELKWTVNPGANHYQIYATDEADGVRKLLAEVEEGSYQLQLPEDRVITYHVTATFNGVESNPSDSVCIVRPPSGKRFPRAGEESQKEARIRHIRKLLEISDRCEDSGSRVKVEKFGLSTQFISLTSRYITPAIGSWYIAFPDGTIEPMDGNSRGRAYVVEFAQLWDGSVDNLVDRFIKSNLQISSARSIPGFDRNPPPPEVIQAIKPLSRTIAKDGVLTIERYGWARYGGAVSHYTFVFNADSVLTEVRVKVLARDVGAAEYYY